MYVKEPRKEATVGDAVKLAKDTKRNNICPCGCGNKAKKCPNGRRVLEFKRLLGGALSEAIIVWIVLLFVGAIFFNARKEYLACIKQKTIPVPTFTGYKCVDSATAAKTNP